MIIQRLMIGCFILNGLMLLFSVSQGLWDTAALNLGAAALCAYLGFKEGQR